MENAMGSRRITCSFENHGERSLLPWTIEISAAILFEQVCFFPFIDVSIPF
jgi:hypothetical protein